MNPFTFSSHWRRGLVGVALMVAAVCSATFVAAAPVDPAVDTVIVPYDVNARPIDDQVTKVYVPYERFLYLWEAAKQNRRPAAAQPGAPIAWALTSARYDGVVGRGSVAFTAQFDLLTGGDAWQSVSLPFPGARLTGVRLDGTPTAISNDALLVEKAGRHRVDINFEVALPPGAKTFEWGIPRAAGALVTLTWPDTAMTAAIEPGSGSVEQMVNGAKRVTAAIGSANHVKVTLAPAPPALRSAQPDAAVIRMATTVAAGAETTQAEVAFSFPGMKQDHFSVSFDDGLSLVDLSGVDLQAWKVLTDGARQRLEVTLGAPAEGRWTLSLGLRKDTAALPYEGQAPALAAAAGRVDIASVAVVGSDRLEVAPRPGPGLRQIEWAGSPAEGHGVAYAGGVGLRWSVALAAPRAEARIEYLYQVNRRQIELFASLQLEARSDPLFATEIGLPPGFTVQLVQSARLLDWQVEGDKLRVRFTGPTPEVTSLVLDLVRQDTAPAATLEARPLRLAGFHKITGEAAIAAFKDVDVRMELKGSARTIAPAGAAADYKVLAPLERKLAFAFDEPDFTAQLTLASQPPRLNALWTLEAQAHDGWLALSAKVQLSLRQGSVDHARFSLPAALPEVRVAGDGVRETRSKIEGDRRVYDVQFQNDVFADVEFTFAGEAPLAGETALPNPEFPDAQFTTGYVVLGNASESEMRTTPASADSVRLTEIPWVPADAGNAQAFRTAPGWSIKITLDRLEKAESRSAFCPWAELTTAFRNDGSEWHRAVWRLQNRALQFLPVRLPAEADLMAVKVAGEPVRADRGEVDGQRAILVPLIKTDPGERSYDVEMIYRTKQPALGMLPRRGIADPELIGITVERTFWNVWTPKGWKYQGASGNLEQVIEEVAAADKLEDAMKELKSLSSIVSNSQASPQLRARAWGNYAELEKSVLATANAAATPAPSAQYFGEMKTKSGAGKDQRSYAEGKKNSVLGQLVDVSAKVEQFGRDLQNAIVAKDKEKGDKLQTLRILDSNVDQWAMEANPAAAGDKWQSQAGVIKIPGVDEFDFKQQADKQTEKAPQTPEQQVAQSLLNLNGHVALQQQRQEAPAKPELRRADEGIVAGKPDLEASKAELAATPQGNARGVRGPSTFDDRGKVVGGSTVAGGGGGTDRRKDGSGMAPSSVDQLLAEANNYLDTARYQLAEQRAEAVLSIEPTNVEARAIEEKIFRAKDDYAVEAYNTTRAHAIWQVDKAWEMPVRRFKGDADASRASGALDAPAADAALPATPPATAPLGLDGAKAPVALQTPSPRGASVAAPLDAPALLAPAEPRVKNAPGALGRFGVVAGGAGAPPPPPPVAHGLSPEGRLSLAFDFPTEGELVHFKKVKGHGQLEISMVKEDLFEPWKRTGVVVGLAGLLWLLQRRWEKRQLA